MISFRFALLALLAACGGTSGGDWVPSDIDEQQTLDTIGSAGYSRLCSAFEDYVHDQYRSSYLVRAACTAHAIDTTTDAVACGEALDDCLDTLPPAVDSQLDSILAQASCSRVSITPTGCSAKVSQVKACLDALGDQLDEIELAATCAAVGSPVPSDWWMIDTPSACTSLSADC
jgi:hypothetical protein